MKAFLLGGLGLLALASAANAGGLAALLAQAGGRPTLHAPLVAVDWQDPATLPPRFRNHCEVQARSGRSYCADHCGRGYQFYYCSTVSFGCCAVGYGYCDRHDHLRCHP